MNANLRIVSANLYNDHVDARAFGELVVSLSADVVAVQELSNDAAEVLAATLPHGELSPAAGAMGMGIALRRPAKLSRLPLRYRDARVAVLETDDWPELAEPLEIINAHIAAPALSRDVFRIRAEQLASIEAYVDSTDPAPRLLVGDLNSTRLWPVYRRLTTRFSDATYAVARSRGKIPARTWGPPISSLRILRIDHVLARGVTVANVEAVRVAGSDHSALVIDVAVGRD